MSHKPGVGQTGTYGPSSGSLAAAERVATAEAIARAWKEHGLQYGIIHGLEEYPDGGLGRDLDVMIAADQLQRLQSVAVSVWKELGWAVCIHRKPWVWWMFGFKRIDGVLLALEIDLLWTLQWGPAIIARSSRAGPARGPFRIDPWASFVKRILMQLLGGNTVRFRQRPNELFLSPMERDEVCSQLPSFVGKGLTKELLHSLAENDVQGLTALIPALRQRIVGRALTRRPLLSVAASLTWARDEVAQQVGIPCSPRIAIVGPDGVGKSTVIEIVKRTAMRDLAYTNCVVRHWRPGVLPPLARLLGREVKCSDAAVPPRRRPGRFHVVRLAYYFVDFVLGSWKDRRASSLLELVVYDRCALDMAVDPVRYGLRSSRGTRLLWRLIPKPDLVILLKDTPQRIRQRKAELEEEEIARQMNAWLELAREGEVDAVVSVDAGPEEIAARVNDLIVDAFIRKNGGDLASPAARQADDFEEDGPARPSLRVG